jgi:predicted ferric reductase
MIDFGLVVLIWMVQLIIYPSFMYYQEEDLMRWHDRYTGAITVIVMPLMLAQVVLYALDLSRGDISVVKWISVLLIVLIWIHTFTLAVPLHNQIAEGTEVSAAAEKLVRVNWFRTVAWTIIFLLNWIPLR